MDAATIKMLIEKGIPDAQVSVDDVRGDGQHFAAYVTAPVFMGKSRVQQHQMVYAALKDISSQIHALAIQTGVAN
ncbi:MAG: BolA/IbaG family iron-sulfur metabolism protein [Alphaproteobacteria bacterium]|nr:BolA/IbaG family iron-sulfur metabolism protein [Alphaproteobacteria bacterium]